MKHREESWKYDSQRSIFDELRRVSSGDETLCRMFDISSQTKSFLKEKLRMQILSSFSSDFQTLIKHSFSLYFLYELLMSLRSIMPRLSWRRVVFEYSLFFLCHFSNMLSCSCFTFFLILTRSNGFDYSLAKRLVCLVFHAVWDNFQEFASSLMCVKSGRVFMVRLVVKSSFRKCTL